jgi:hypothetical protein
VGAVKSFPIVLLCAALALAPGGPPVPDHELVRGMTISCRTYGWEWGDDGFGIELERLGELGVNWVAIHPYARIGADGSVRAGGGGIDLDAPPAYLTRPLAEARGRGVAVLVKPHLAYWGSPFRWRGEIAFAEPEARARFWDEYSDWIVTLARATSEADAFCIGTELGGMLADVERWRALAARVRAVTDAHLTYAANWDRVQEVGFWGDLDAIGIQAYFPLTEEADPDEEALRAGWRSVLSPLARLHEATGKPVVFTELGYSASPRAATHPWEDPRGRARAFELQRRCLRVALDVLAEERVWLRGAFLWKWFVDLPARGDGSFHLDTPELRRVIHGAWGEAPGRAR